MKKVEYSLSRFILICCAFILAGALTVGLPALIQSKQYYDQAEQAQNEAEELKLQMSNQNNTTLQDSRVLVEQYNDLARERNEFLAAIERIDGDLPNLSPVQCKDNILIGLDKDC